MCALNNGTVMTSLSKTYWAYMYLVLFSFTYERQRFYSLPMRKATTAPVVCYSSAAVCCRRSAAWSMTPVSPPVAPTIASDKDKDPEPHCSAVPSSSPTPHVDQITSSSMLDAVRQFCRRTKFLLMQSKQDKYYQRDTLNQRKWNQMERDKVQWLNDLLIADGTKGNVSLQMKTFDNCIADGGRQLDWGFVGPVVLILWPVVCLIVLFGRSGRDEKNDHLTKVFEGKLEESRKRLREEESEHDKFVKAFINDDKVVS